ncbi:MAG TPA: CCA tRNA nucleotidyltransferase [Candidatus Acidoferrum sp.]|nr:CCA tRNA nucleotidyltransferase [Candidatus Acidoferrum sp.]
MTARDLANSICDTLKGRGYQALLVGGCVRDLLLGREPADFDVATDATPADVMSLFPESVAVGAQFGVVLIPRGGENVEVATFRSDLGYSDGRHPDRVEFSKTAEEDVQRRDFTINGLLMRHDTNEILDFVGGRQDLTARIVRTVGDPDRRFAEDKLRMMRAIRFAARFGFEIEHATFASIRKHAGAVTDVSPERIREELTKLLTEGAARRGFELLEKAWLLSAVLPEIAAMKGVPQPPQYHPEGDVWVHTLLMIGGLPGGSSPTLAWGVLLHDVGKPPTFRPASQTGDRIRFDHHVDIGVRIAHAICKRFRFSNEDTEQIVSLVDNHMKFMHVSEMKKSTLKRFVRLPRFEEHLELHRLDCLSSHRNLGAYEQVSRFLKETPEEQVRPQRVLTGNDLSQLGYSPGPLFSEILGAIEDAQLEGEILTRDQAIDFVRRKFAPRKAKT